MPDWSIEQPLLVACLRCALAGACVAGAALYFRRRGQLEYRLTVRQVTVVGIFMTALMLTAAWWYGLRDSFPRIELDEDMARFYRESRVILRGGRRIPSYV